MLVNHVSSHRTFKSGLKFAIWSVVGSAVGSIAIAAAAVAQVEPAGPPAPLAPAPLAPVTSAPASPAAAVKPLDDDQSRPVVQIALLLDTSNSMDGLINQARTQLWSIVNDISKGKRDGKIPRLQVAVYEYGNNQLAAGEGYVRMVVPFTSDLDLVSEKLFALRTDGGSEFCGQVIESATRELSWDTSPGTYKAVFIAGNEPFTQGQLDYRLAVGKSLSKEIIINTIHCGSYQDGIEGKWKDGADLGRGKFMVIDQDKTVVHVPAPQDDRLLRLSAVLNETYLPFGIRGAEGRMRQVASDAASEAAAPAAAIARANVKAGSNYDNSGWDLIDALDKKSVKLEDVADTDKPESLRGKPIQEQVKLIDSLRAKRAEIQKEIATTNLEREAFLAKQNPADAKGGQTLDEAARDAIREQLKAMGFGFED